MKIIYFIVSVIIIFVIYETTYYTQDATSIAPDEPHSVSLHVEQNHLLKDIPVDNEPRVDDLDMYEISKKGLQKMGFSAKLAEQLLDKDPRKTIALSDYPKHEANLRLKEYQMSEKRGYVIVDPKFMQHELTIKDNLYSAGNADEYAKFRLSKVPEELHSGYIGFTREDLPADSDKKSSVIRRVFAYKNMVVSLEESSSHNGSGHYITEFVNARVGDYPAIFNGLGLSDKQIIYQMAFDTDDYRYALYSISTKSPLEQRKVLQELADKILSYNQS